MSGISTAGGTGSNAIENAYIEAYRDGFEQQFQQFDTKIAQYFDVVPQDGEFQFYDRIGLAEELVEVTDRHGDNPVSDIPHDRRRIGLRDFEQGRYLEPKDLYRLASDPKNAYTTALKAAAHRKMDKIVLERIFGTAYAGKKGEQAVSFVDTNAGKITVGNLSKGHTRPITTSGDYQLQTGDVEGIDVAVGYKGPGVSPANDGLNLAKLKAARFTMIRMEAIDVNEILDCWLTEAQLQQLLKIDEIINSDYAVRKALAEGSVTTYMGFRFLHAENLLGSGTAADPRQCIVAKKNAVKVAYAKNLEFNMWRDTAKKNIPYMYLNLAMEAQRMWGEITCKVNCLD